MLLLHVTRRGHIRSDYRNRETTIWVYLLRSFTPSAFTLLDKPMRIVGTITTSDTERWAVQPPSIPGDSTVQATDRQFRIAWAEGKAFTLHRRFISNWMGREVRFRQIYYLFSCKCYLWSLMNAIIQEPYLLHLEAPSDAPSDRSFLCPTDHSSVAISLATSPPPLQINESDKWSRWSASSWGRFRYASRRSSCIGWDVLLIFQERKITHRWWCQWRKTRTPVIAA